MINNLLCLKTIVFLKLLLCCSCGFDNNFSDRDIVFYFITKMTNKSVLLFDILSIIRNNICFIFGAVICFIFAIHSYFSSK